MRRAANETSGSVRLQPVLVLAVFWILSVVAHALPPDTHPFHLDDRAMPGEESAHTMALRHADAETVHIRHSEDHRAVSHPLRRGEEDVWSIAVADFGLQPGAHAFKFMIDGEWEPVANRPLDGRVLDEFVQPVVTDPEPRTPNPDPEP